MVLRLLTLFGGASKASKVRSYLLDKAGAATGSFSNCGISALTENHVSNLLMLGECKIRRYIVGNLEQL
jgi:hypothetical protein